MTETLEFDPGQIEALVKHLSSPPADRVWKRFDIEGGVAFASLSHRDPAIGHLDLLAVQPQARGRGLGKQLVRQAEEWLRGQGAREARFAGNPPCYAWPGIDVRYTAAACLAERLGYERYHTAWNMTADLSLPFADEEVPGVTLHSGADERVLAFVHDTWNRFWAWEAEHAAGLHYAMRDGEVVAFAAWGARPEWFGPMGTSPRAEGLGLGGVLLRRCLAEQRAAGQAQAQIGWVGPLRFYSRAVGARAERVFWLYRRELG
ncbi:GNAT family N-acetyltransferase [Nonomuraea soli]|uniref:GNAT superfamily N-acetyltransferase n=1 Tax=Nonomuraea soli TaxID=1032476 RepID=A0A7W0CFZ9_9ACTN|nr:GNAT family N-acetyltransferase [Nonomuraea soli]MBA2890448.1 GNAT superfamily N-acetyltransferase [Nonomuraea soli]